jgi:hypothetical protein
MKFTLIIVFSFLPCFISAQTVINGNVKNKENKPVTASMTVQAKGSNTVAGFGATDKDGNYNVKYKGTADSITVTASGINIGKHQQTVVNRSGRVDFVIDETPLELEEIKVTPMKIRRSGDTLDYSVAAYSDQNDRVIGDILKKLPGVYVAENGRIQYNGKDINKFYIENMDLLQGRYGLATNNISAKDVATVQIMEDHQPIKALKDRIFSDRAAINLKLKDAAKGTLALSAMAGLGYEPFMWDAELVSLYFAKRQQNISTYKANNSGDNVTSEFQVHYGYEYDYVESNNSLYIQSPSTPPVSEKRYLQNNANAFTLNHLVKLKNDWECTVNALYYNDHLKKEGYSVYEQYFAGDSTLAIEEKVSSVNNRNNAEVAVRLNANTNDYYFNNSFNIKGNWDNDRGFGNTKSAGIDENISQELNKPSFSVDNTLKIVKNIKQNSYNVNFSARYASSPHTLTVTPALSSIVGEGNLSSIIQDMRSNDFASILQLSYGTTLGDFTLDYSIGEKVDIHNLNTSLYGGTQQERETPDSLKNNLFYNNYQTEFHQTYSYRRGKFKSTVDLPLTYYLLTVDDRIPDKFAAHNKLIFNPSAYISYNITQELTVSANANYGKLFGDMSSSYTGYIMHGYRNLLKNTIDRLFEFRSEGAGTGIGYRSAFNALFINAGINYSRSWKNLLYGYNYQGVMSVKTTIDQPTESDAYRINFGASKGLSFLGATLRISGEYSKGRGEQLIQDEILKYHSQGYSAGSSINAVPFSFIGINYSFLWRQNKSFVIERSERFFPIRETSQNMQINIFPTKTLTVIFRAEHQYNSAIIDGNRYTSFADAGVKFKRKKLDLELEFNNIFNSKQYVSASYSDISTYYYTYNLRPASILLRARFKLK